MQNSTSGDVNANLQFPAVQVAGGYLGSVIGERTGAVNWTPHSVAMPMGKYEIKSLVVKIASHK